MSVLGMKSWMRLNSLPATMAFHSSSSAEDKWMKVEHYRQSKGQFSYPGTYRIGQKRPFFLFGVKTLYIGQSTVSVCNRLDAHLNNRDNQIVGKYLAKRSGWGRWRIWLRPWALRVKVNFCSNPEQMEAQLLKAEGLPELNRRKESGNRKRKLKWLRLRRRIQPARIGTLVLLVMLGYYVYKIKVLE